VLVLGALFAAFGPSPAVVWAVAALVVAARCGVVAGRRMHPMDPASAAADSKPFWLEIRPLGVWASVGALIYWLFSQSYNYVLAGRISLTAVADVNAARLLLMPTIVLTVGIKGLLNPMAAAWLVEFGIGTLTRRLLALLAGFVVVNLAYFVLVWIFRDWLTSSFLHKVITDRDRLLVLWACVSFISLIRDVLQSALQALERFKPMAWLTGAAAITSLSIMWFGIAWWGASAALIGQMSGEVLNQLGIVYLLRQAHRRS